MSEYWVSQARHFCTYCKIYIADNKISRQIHEGGKKHKETVSKFLSDVQKRSVQDKKNEEEIQRQLKKIEKAAMTQYQKDLVAENPNLAPSELPKIEPSDPEPAVKKRKQPSSSSSAKFTPILPQTDSSVTPGPWKRVPTTEEDKVAQNHDRSNDREQGSSSLNMDDDDDEGQDPEDLKSFKVQEKTFPDSSVVDLATDGDGKQEVTFKKRKTTSSRNIRKKM